MEEKIKALTADTVCDLHLPRYEQIPDVGLYLEQVTKYICSFLEPLNGVSLTASMISNYVKKHLIENPNKKLYARDQIAYLIFIAVAKSVLSLDQIAIMFELQRRSYSREVAYEYFREQFEQMLQFVFGRAPAPEQVGDEISGEKTMLRNTIITVAHKIYLDAYFAAVSVKTGRI